MSLNVFKQSIDLGDGRIIEIETGKLAKQADGAVVVKMGDTMLLATVVSNKDAKEGVDFLPLSVDYQEKYAAAGRIPGGFLRREARLSDYEVLISRIVDRALRPLFPEDYHADTQVMISLISSDKDIMPDALAGLAASAALAVSDIPFNGPISEVRVAKIDGQLVINPSRTDLERATLEFIVAGSAKDINMVEGEADEIAEADLVEAIQFAHVAIKKQCAAQEELTKLVGKTEKRTYSHENSDLELKAKITADTYDQVYAVAKSGAGKDERAANFKAIQNEVLEALGEDATESTKFLAKKYFHDVQYDAVRALLLDEGIRLDGRSTTQIRPIWSEIGYLPSAHGSAIFTRGETQSLTTVTLGAKDDEQLIDGAFINGYNKFMLHYNFPAFSTGEARPNRGVGRREVGHGNLAMRAIKKVLPADADNPYTIRIVSDILESNGSSSMATVCAGTLALMDAGIKIKAPVTGIAMGLISDEATGKYAILSDILGDEDHLGDMDFKVAGTEDGITSLQMDIKITGITFEIMEKALSQAKDGRIHILGEMNKALKVSRKDLSKHTPKMEKVTVDKKDIAAIIGKGGVTIREIVELSGAKVDISDDGIVTIAAPDEISRNKALEMVKSIIAKAEVGKIYTGKVVKIMEFGAFVNFLGKQDGLVHISELAAKRVEKVSDVVKEGDEVKVKVLGFDKGKVKLSIKQALDS